MYKLPKLKLTVKKEEIHKWLMWNNFRFKYIENYWCSRFMFENSVVYVNSSAMLACALIFETG